MAEYIVEYLDEEETCKDCLHIEACDAWVRHGATLYDDYHYSVEGCPFHVPAADVEEVKHGHWLEQNISGEQTWCCSECKTLGSPHWKRCPVCEVKMDGGKENGV